MVLLTSAEELLLFLLDEPSGALLPLTSRTQGLAFAGAVLMDLQLKDRIDTDLDTLTLTNPTPVGNSVLDSTLADIAAAGAQRGAPYWVERIAQRGEEIRERTIADLVTRGILVDPGDEGGLTLAPEVAHARRYPTIDGVRQEDVRLRVMRVLFSDEIPDPADIVIISLIDACDVWRKVLSAPDLTRARKRIDVVSRLDLIGRTVATLARAVRPTARAGRRGSDELPVASRLPLIGSTLGLMRSQRRFYRDQYHRLGPVFRVRTLTGSFVVMAGQEANLFLLRSERSHLHAADMWDPLCAEFGASRFVLNMNGQDHVRMRRELKDGFSRSLIESQLPTAIDVVRRRVDAMPLNAPLPGLQTMQRLVGETAGLLGAGTSTDEYIDDVLVLLRKMMRRGVFGIPALPRGPRLRRASRRVAELSDKLLMDHQLQQHGRKADVIDDVLELHRADPMFLPEMDVALTALLPLFAGIDTAASVSACMLYTVLKNPGLGKLVRAEADALFAGDGPMVEKAREMDVTYRTMLETMRMYTPGPGLMRRVTTSFDFCGYRIPAGENLVIASTVTHDLPGLFPDPQRFDIDRYLPGREEHKRPGAFAPFGFGLHHCAGRGFAEMQIPLMMATLLHEADLQLAPPTYELKTVEVPFLSPDRRLKFKVTGRRHASTA